MDDLFEDLMDDMVGSLKRAEHSNYVSLKYTRTVDLIKSLVDRYIATIESGVNVLLYWKNEPMDGPLIQRINKAKELFPDDEVIQDNMEFILFLRKISRAQYSSEEEYRRHVTMIVKMEEEEYRFDIDKMDEYFQKVKAFINHVRSLVLDEEGSTA